MSRFDVADEIRNRFTYHKPVDGQEWMYQSIREAGKTLAGLIDLLCPDSREKSLAITKVEEAVMWANASIARTGHVVEKPEED